MLMGTSQSAFPWEKDLPLRRQLLPPPPSPPPFPLFSSPTSTFSSLLPLPPLFPSFSCLLSLFLSHSLVLPSSFPFSLPLFLLSQSSSQDRVQVPLLRIPVRSVGKKGCYKVAGMLSKTSQTHISPSHLLGNDPEEGVSVCRIIGNKWIFAVSNGVGGEATVGAGEAEDSKA